MITLIVFLCNEFLNKQILKGNFIIPLFFLTHLDCVHIMLVHFENGEKCNGREILTDVHKTSA